MSASLHRNTPTIVAFDPRGLTVRTLAYHRANAQTEPQPRISRQVYGASGFVQQQWDPRQYAASAQAPRARACETLVHSLSGTTLLRDSADAGRRLMLLSEAGQLLRTWDNRGACQRYAYDTLQRPVAVFEQAADEPRERCVERLTYAGATPEAAALNSCGRLVRHADPAGTLLINAYAIDQSELQQTRRFRLDAAPVDWPATVEAQDLLLERAAYTTTRRYDAVGGLLEQIDAKGNRQHRTYGLHGRLKALAITPEGGVRNLLLHERAYNANGQLTFERAGTTLIKTLRYAPQSARLLQMKTYRQGEADKPLQDLAYTYDPVGNILSLSDRAQPTQWHSNTRIEARNRYEYDTLYQLTLATGWENARSTAGQAPPPQVLFGATDDGLWRPYTQRYTYDEGGNLTLVRHASGIGSGYTRRMTLAPDSNRAVPGDSPPTAAAFDGNGNQRMLGSGQQMVWNVRNQLAYVTQVVRAEGEPDVEAYLYDAQGQRVLKVRRNQVGDTSHTQRTYYLPGLQMHWRRGQRLNLLDLDVEGSRVTVLQWEHGRPDGLDAEQVQFHVLDHLNSSLLVVDEQGRLLSQEGYYPYGATSWSASRTAIQGDDRLYRYAGKERDATGLYYYGARYYAPWLQRWISPDPAGDGDGLNLYAMVRGNPLRFTDAWGGQATFGEQFQPSRGDMIFGLSAAVTHYRSFWSKLTARGDILAAYFSGPDVERWTGGLASALSEFGRFREMGTPEPQERDTGRERTLAIQVPAVARQFYQNILARYSGCSSTTANRQFVRRFVEELAESDYSFTTTVRQHMGHGLRAIQEKVISRSSKSALATLTSPQSRAVVHFALEGVDMEAVIRKTRRSVTGSELRWLYRHRQQLAGRVIFYRGQQRVDAPWDTRASAWKAYRPRSAAVRTAARR
ncbi:RHS repeat-associated core domain-containing protein [Pseudomonas sp. SR18]|uniref:RHS repeat-associated core domain-containing protein n=1 Tax=Pseudomonas sp. SR18 TaxID=1461074 RepID=UPI0020343E0D|nr:RHS repeat-associated core domain-containing protein [Pseudomonas sp. SR18]MCM2360537.1 sugar-binding protein [Pseudomonas sp. SR18]